MKNHALIEFLSKYDGKHEVIIDGSTEFLIEETGDADDRQIIIIKR
jgi:hypothetical protein